MTHQGHRLKTLSQEHSALFCKDLETLEKAKLKQVGYLATKFMSKSVISDTLDAAVNARSVVNLG